MKTIYKTDGSAARVVMACPECTARLGKPHRATCPRTGHLRSSDQCPVVLDHEACAYRHEPVVVVMKRSGCEYRLRVDATGHSPGLARAGLRALLVG